MNAPQCLKMATVLENLSELDINKLQNRIKRLKTKIRPETGCVEVLKGSRTGVSAIHESKKGYPSITVTRNKRSRDDPRLTASLPVYVVVFFLNYKIIAKKVEHQVTYVAGQIA